MGYGDTRANKSRVHTRMINSGSGNHEVITIWGTESGLQWKLRTGFDPIMVEWMTGYPLHVGASPEHVGSC